MSNTTNKIIKNKKSLILSHWYLLVVLVVLVVFPKRAAAADLSLGISPPVIQIQISPPAVVNTSITIENNGEETVTLAIQFKPFTAGKGETDEVVYRSDYSPLVFKNIKVRDNDEIVEKVVIGPKQNKTLNLNINIPKDESLSDYYFSVIFISENTSDETLNQSRILGGIATNILLSIKSGEENIGKIVEFSSPRFLEKGPVPFKIRLKNESKHFITPDGEILIKNIFGKTIGQVKLPPVNILAGTTRKENVSLNNGYMLGAYKATLILNISNNGPVLIKSKTFFVFPLWASIVFVGVVIVILIINNRIKKFRNRK
jgi:hypothetical protein